MSEEKNRYWKLLASAWAVPLLFVLLYRLGGPGELMLYPLLVTPLFVLYHKHVQRPLYFALLGLLYFALLGLDLALAVAVGSALNTWLYYRFVSNDGMTPVVGMLMAFLGVGLTLLVTLILTIVKAIVQKKEPTHKNN